MLGVVFAAVALGSGLGVARLLRLRSSLAPGAGLAAMVVLATWAAALRVPPQIGGAALVLVSLVGVAAVRPARTARLAGALAVLGIATGLAELLLALAFGSLDVPISPHDGAFHVEFVNALRHGDSLHSWYPLGFHASVSALLALFPSIDSARGTVEAAQGLTLLVPVSVYGLGRALRMPPVVAATAGLVQAITFVYPYDYQIWGGWPLGTSLLLLLALWAAAASWLDRPTPGLAALVGLLTAAIVLTHGTEVYSAVVGLLVLAALSWRQVAWRQLPGALAVALVVAGVLVVPYLAVLLGWAAAGGATSAAAQASASEGSQITAQGWADYVLSPFGSASLVDWPARVVLLVLGASLRRTRVIAGIWLVFSLLVLVGGPVGLPGVRVVYDVTYPWLADRRPVQIAAIAASLLIASGVARVWEWLLSMRPRLATRRHAWRRLATAGVILAGFFVEGSAVSVYKTLAQFVGDWNIYTADDRAAMTWLRQHAQADAMLANNGALDAGIWAPYKAELPVLLPRSANGATLQARAPIAEHIADLPDAPGLEHQACQLHLRYVYLGARELTSGPPLLPDRTDLERATDLQEVFRSGQAVVFRVRLDC